MINNVIVDSVFKVLPDRLEKFLDSSGMDDRLMNDVELLDSIKIPVYYFTKCWDFILRDNNWNESVQKNVASFRERHFRMKRIFEERFNVDFDKIDIPFKEIGDLSFNKYGDIGSLYDNCDFIEISLDLMKKQYRELDLLLYETVRTLDYKRAVSLVEQGANPEVFMYDGDVDDLPEDEDERQRFLFGDCHRATDLVTDILYSYWQSSNIGGMIIDFKEPSIIPSGFYLDLFAYAAYSRFYYLFNPDYDVSSHDRGFAAF